MSLYQCERCGAKENTALGSFWNQEEKLCSECATGTWHGKFPKRILPLGMFKTNGRGNLQHKENGDTDLSAYEIKGEKT